MKIKVITILALLLAVIYIIPYLFRFSTTYFLSSKCLKMGGGYNLTYCFNEIAQQKKDIKICDLLFDSQKKWKCYSGIASLNKDENICIKIKDKNIQDMCFVFLKKCDLIQLSSNKDTCYSSISTEKIDLISCNKIKNQKLKDYCHVYIGDVKADLSICNEIFDTDLKDECYFDVNQRRHDTEICEGINNSAIKSKCYYANGQCDKVIDLGLKDECYYVYAKKHTTCNYINSVIIANNCYEKLAISNRDINICGYILDNDKQGNCRSQITTLKKASEERLSICTSLSSIHSKDICFMIASFKSQDKLLCDYIQDMTIKKNCLPTGLSIDLRDENFCNNIENISLKERCFSLFQINNPN